MKSAELRRELQARVEAMEADGQAAHGEDYQTMMVWVFDSIITNCLHRSEEMHRVREEHFSFFSQFSYEEIEALEAMDPVLAAQMESVWMKENEWCCCLDFGDAKPAAHYIGSFYRALLKALEHAEERYGPFDMLAAE